MPVTEPWLQQRVRLRETWATTYTSLVLVKRSKSKPKYPVSLCTVCISGILQCQVVLLGVYTNTQLQNQQAGISHARKHLDNAKTTYSAEAEQEFCKSTFSVVQKYHWNQRSLFSGSVTFSGRINVNPFCRSLFYPGHLRAVGYIAQIRCSVPNFKISLFNVLILKVSKFALFITKRLSSYRYQVPAGTKFPS
jgi:hypothetical protein